MMPLRSFVRHLFIVTLAAGLAMVPAVRASSASGVTDVLKATLPNGLRVVILRNTIAPVVSTEMTYLVGSRDDPAGVPGMAHAQEHMLFRGTPNLTTSELGTVATALGGAFNAATSDTTTQYQFTVPAANLDAVLRIESDRMRNVLDAQSQWRIERGAIEQEVLRDESEPGGDFFSAMHQLAFAGTPYGHEGVGTRASFDRLTGPQIKAFYDRWYAPNNAVFVIAGDVDPQQTLAAVRERFASIPRRAVPAHRVAHFAPLDHLVLSRPTTLVYPLAVVAFRFPGIESPDFLASYVLQGILSSQRGPLQGLIDTGESLGGGWDSEPYVPEAQLAFATAALRPGGDPLAAAHRIEGLLKNFADHGVSSELFLSTQRRLIADQEVSRNSIEALASDWATTIAVDGEPSIAHEQQLIANVTLADVNRVAKRYLDMRHTIVGALTPSASASQNAAAAPAQLAPEKPLDVGSQATTLPPWAGDLVRHIDVPAVTQTPVRTKLANGMTLIVQPETISDSVFVYGRVKTNPALQEPDGKDGVASILETMFEYGSKEHDRLAFQRLQDDADTQLSAGMSFGLQTTSRTFDRAIALLAENELQPRFDAATFGFAQRRATDELASSLGSSATLARRRTNEYFLPANDPELREPTVNGMQALTLGDVETYYAKTMRPDLTTIVVVGNVTADDARAAIERGFGAWQAGGDTPDLKLPPLPPNRAGTVNLSLPIGQDSVFFDQVVSLPRDAPAVYPLMLGTAILGGNGVSPEQSRLFRDIRQNAGLVYTIGSRVTPRRSQYDFSIEFACLPANEPRISALVDAEIERMRTEPVNDFELSLAKASTVRKAVIADASVSAIGVALLDNAAAGLPLDQWRIDAQHVLATDAHAIQDAFATSIDPKNFVRVIEGP